MFIHSFITYDAVSNGAVLYTPPQLNDVWKCHSLIRLNF